MNLEISRKNNNEKGIRPDSRDALSYFQIACVSGFIGWFSYKGCGIVRLTYEEHMEQFKLNTAMCPLCGRFAMIPDEFTNEQPRQRIMSFD